MVGSGFSRNATKVHLGVAEIPLWSDLEAELAASLPDSRSRRGFGAKEEKEPTAGGVLELAQKYEDEFKRARLHEFLIRSVRDDSFQPGDLHRRLLALPWRDVFTTNWDTLLERCLPLPERAYGVVTSADHLPVVAPPRIVKLHGSLPGAFPLIVTKGDYEAYRDNFAPFVNTVQQSMMETVFLLLGFSGKDPNFRQWLGWVQENLGENMPRIYLANWLAPDNDERAEQKDRKVVPIDLSRHPKALDWPEPVRRAKAMEWLLLSLEQGRPYPTEDWPEPVKPGGKPVSADLEPVKSVPRSGPSEELRSPPKGGPDHLEAARDVLSVWRRNRSCYPSWLVLPFERATFMRYYTDHWESAILKVLPHLADGAERLGALRELIWRREAQLDPLPESPELMGKVAEVLDEVDCERRLVGGEKGIDQDWERLRRQWRELAAALLTAARYGFDREKFRHWIARLAPFLAEDGELAERVRHEECLWSLNHHDFERLEELVDRWQPQASDPAWFLRRASLLMELGRTEKARELGLGVLETVRKWPSEKASLAAPSREAWALSLVEATRGHRGDVAARHQELQSRFRELAPYRCDPRAEFSGHERAVSTPRQGREYKPFDLGVKNVQGLSFSRVASLRALAAFRAIRFTETVGSPSVVSGDLLVRSAEALLPYSPQWSCVLSVGFSYEEAKRRFSKTLSRWRIARMAREQASPLAEAQQRTVRLALDRLDQNKGRSQGWWIWLHRLEAALEALSRFVLRLKPVEVERVLVLVRDLYCDSRLRSHLGQLGALSHLLSRSWEALPASLKAQHALDFLRLPLPGVNGFEVEAPAHLVDPGWVLHSDRVSWPSPERSDGNDEVWAKAVRLVANGLGAGGTARKRAALRLAVMAEWEELRADECRRLGDALWNFGVDEHGMPLDTDLRSWVFLRLPEPVPGQAEKRLRASWLPSAGWASENIESVKKVLAEAGAALERLPDLGHSIDFTKAEKTSLGCAVAQWAASALRRVAPWEGNQEMRQRRRAFRNISTLLLELDVNEATAELLLGHVEQLAAGETPAFELLPAIVKAVPQKSEHAAALLLVGLGGATRDQERQAASACGGLYRWLRASTRASGLPAPPAGLVFELGVIISAHRWCALSNALDVAGWVFESGTDEHRELLLGSCLAGLASLRRVLVFDENLDPSPYVERPDLVSEDEVDVPWLRWRCVGLAAAMNRAGLGSETAVAGWLKDAEGDPLPELRFAAEDLRSGAGVPNP